jgi:hypothetical protein
VSVAREVLGVYGLEQVAVAILAEYDALDGHTLELGGGVEWLIGGFRCRPWLRGHGAALYHRFIPVANNYF